MHTLRLQRPHHADLVNTQPNGLRKIIINAQIFERLPHVEVGLARSHDPQAWTRRINRDVVQLVHTSVVNRHVNFVIVHELFLLKRRVRPADVHAAFGQRKIGRNDRLDTIRINDDAGGGFHRIGHGLHADIAAGVAAHRVAMHAKIEVFLHARRIQNRDDCADEFVIGLMRQRGRLRAMIVARDQEDATMLRRARMVRMLEYVAATIHARTLAVPHGEHAVVLGLWIQI